MDKKYEIVLTVTDYGDGFNTERKNYRVNEDGTKTEVSLPREDCLALYFVNLAIEQHIFQRKAEEGGMAIDLGTGAAMLLLKPVLMELRKKVTDEIASISDVIAALREHPEIFKEVAEHMVKISEKAGEPSLPMLDTLVRHLGESEHGIDMWASMLLAGAKSPLAKKIIGEDLGETSGSYYGGTFTAEGNRMENQDEKTDPTAE